MKSLELFVIGVQSNISQLMHLIIFLSILVGSPTYYFCFWETSMALCYFTLYVKFEGWGEKDKKFSQLLKIHNLLIPKWSKHLVYKYSRDSKHLATKSFFFLTCHQSLSGMTKQFRALLLTALDTQALGRRGFSIFTPSLLIQVQSGTQNLHFF